ncbi:MAG: DUF2079 domain-containing protein [Candidatus Coatesbacteria bacterium]|nr:MAG: DUF2079 domain-containing protein [Candidatus Coatesbacteria bacterium]
MSAAISDILLQLAVVAGAGAVAAFASRLAARRKNAPSSLDRSGARAAVLLGAAVASFAALFAYLALRKFATGHAAAVDLGLQHQVYWAGARGGFLHQTVLFSIPHLNHLALLNQLLAPLSLLWPAPSALLVLQSAALAAAAVPAYLLARRHTSSPYLAWAFAVSPLLFVPLQWTALYDFHPRALAPLLLLMGLWGVDSDRPRLGLLFLFLATLILEELAIYVGAAGLFLALGLRRRALGFAVAAFAAAYFLAATYVVYPHLMNVADPGANPILNTFGVAASPAGFVAYLFRHPGEILGRAAEGARWAYLLHAVTPWAFFPLAAGWGWLTYVLPAGYALFSVVPSHHSLQHQYALPLVPFLLYFALRGWRRLRDALASRGLAARAAARAGATAYLVVAGVAGSALWGPLGLKYNPNWYRPEAEGARFPRVARLVSAERSLGASMFELPHFSARQQIYLFPQKFERVYFLFPHEVLARTARLDEPWLKPRRGDESRTTYELVRLLRNRRYGCMYADGNYVLLRRGAHGAVPAATAFAWTYQTIEEDGFDANVGVTVYDPRARNGRALYCSAAQGPLGAAARTAPRHWPAGPVKVYYRLAQEAPAEPFRPAARLAVVAVDAAGDTVPVAVRPVLPTDLPPDGSYGWTAVTFTAEPETRYGFLLYPTGTADLRLDYLYVEAPTLTLEKAFAKPALDDPRRSAWEAAALRRFASPVPPDFELR